ncbi:glycosyltransferase [Kaistia algarum]|uniref:glycosyltransferase family 2 protein n=1 Tax=Kaistia algarum TaxID=2083279 RepID=UPI000CE82041|nr:glycosyltransferase family 2 protein [Kaistia algarum]MCX5514642.1 glycosyltransferase family 2 protein [Kaistia algarum]PPE78925.1 glycosyltransferase [Kaistia algarum]
MTASHAPVPETSPVVAASSEPSSRLDGAGAEPLRRLLSVVVPVYNEVDVLDLFLERIEPVLQKAADQYGLDWEIVAVDDGSTDGTGRKLRELAISHRKFVAVLLARNFGKEAALTAGLEHAIGEAVVPIDVDLQDPPELIFEFIRHWLAGADMVVGVRSDRSSDSAMKRWTSGKFYRVFNALCRPGIPENAGDYRLMDRKVVDAVLSMPEGNRFMKGIFAWVGFDTVYVDFVREARSAGQTSWSYLKLMRYSIDAITGYSTVPLRIWSWVGFVVASISLIYGIYFFVKALVLGDPVAGFPTLITVTLFASGVQMMGLGVIGEYLGRLYLEAKRRPIYIAKDVIGRGSKDRDARQLPSR